MSVEYVFTCLCRGQRLMLNYFTTPTLLYIKAESLPWTPELTDMASLTSYLPPGIARPHFLSTRGGQPHPPCIYIGGGYLNFSLFHCRASIFLALPPPKFLSTLFSEKRSLSAPGAH